MAFDFRRWSNLFHKNKWRGLGKRVRAYNVISDEEVAKDLGRQFRLYREFSGLSLDEVAEKAGLKSYEVSLFEEDGECSLKDFVALARAINDINSLEAVFDFSPFRTISEFEEARRRYQEFSKIQS